MMSSDIEQFSAAFSCIASRDFVCGIEKFAMLIQQHPDSDLADDAKYNIALCYFEMNEFLKAITELEELIKDYPEGTIAEFDGANEFGKTAAKGYFLMMNCYLGLGNLQKAKEMIPILEKYPGSYILEGNKRVTYAEVGKKALDTYVSLMKK